MKRVLLIDDDVDLLGLLKKSLEKTGYRVIATTHCKDALTLIYQNVPEVIVLDINIGDQDGREFCKEIKSSADLMHIPVIMISANTALLGTYRDYGAEYAMEKPFLAAQLMEAIESHASTTS